MDSFKDGAFVADVSRGSKAETTDQTGAHIGENVSVEVGHDKNLVIVGERVSDHLEARVVEKFGIELDVRELLGNGAGSGEEETVGHLHDGGLVDGADLLAANGLSMLEGITKDALAGISGNELDALDNSVNDNVLNS